MAPASPRRLGYARVLSKNRIMAEPLKNNFGPAVPRAIAAMLASHYPGFHAKAFITETLKGYDELELMPRGRHIARVLRHYLPEDYPQAAAIIVASLHNCADVSESSMSSFVYMPFTFFVAEYGLDHFEESMQAQYELTQHFTAEFSIRPFLEHHSQQTLKRLGLWAKDPSEHVRRLVSEGTRPRLPWAPRLRAFQQDPSPVLSLLELLKDDPALYVRRSVANNLNDIGKDNPGILLETARRWMEDASPERSWIVRHALRSAVKRGVPGAFEVLGYGGESDIAVRNALIAPSRTAIGDTVEIGFDVVNTGITTRRVVVDFQVHYVKSAGNSNPKVFKLASLQLPAGGMQRLNKKLSLQQRTTRKHYPGMHSVDALVNGRAFPLGAFEVIDSK